MALSGISLQYINSNSTEQSAFEELERLLPGVTSDIENLSLHQLFEPFIKKLVQIDESNELLDVQVKDKISKLLSQILHYCHREEVVNDISLVICKFKRNLKNLHFDQPPEISRWPSATYKSLKHLFHKLPADKIGSVSKYLDLIYLKEGLIPHLEWFLRLHPELFNYFCEITHAFRNQSSIPETQKIFIALIAVSNFGSVYMWSRLVNKYFQMGGEIDWILFGIQKAPKYFVKIAKLSEIIAYSPESLNDDTIFQDIGTSLSKQYITQTLLIIIYYQCLACYSHSLGLVPEQHVDENLLKLKSLHIPSKISFQNIYNIENSNEQCQVRTGVTVLKRFSQQEEEDNEQICENVKKLRTTSQQLNLSFESNKSHSLDDLYCRINQSTTFKKIQQVFSKFAYFTISMEDQQENVKLKNVQNSKPHLKTLMPKKNCAKSITHASQWDFVHTSSIINEYFSQDNKISIMLGKVFDSLDSLTLNSKFSKKKAKDIQYYYQFLCYYMHVHVDYRKLITEDLSQQQKFLVKLVTKAPYLISEAGIKFFQEQESLGIEKQLLSGQLEIISLISIIAKLQVLINLAMKSYSAYMTRMSN